MKTPEKLYYAPYGDIREDYPITDNDIEYTRTDAFIEKACGWLNGFMECSNLFEYEVSESEKKEVIEHFKNYMKGE